MPGPDRTLLVVGLSARGRGENLACGGRHSVRTPGSTLGREDEKNRKKADTYRFNGLWGINSVGIDELESLIQKFVQKLTDTTRTTRSGQPSGCDDSSKS